MIWFIYIVLYILLAVAVGTTQSPFRSDVVTGTMLSVGFAVAIFAIMFNHKKVVKLLNDF